MSLHQFITLPDDSIVEYAHSPPQFPPGGSGQHTNGPMPVWYRVNEGEWKLSGFRSAHKVYQWLDACQSVDDVEEAMKG